jgi:hypothetical protein
VVAASSQLWTTSVPEVASSIVDRMDALLLIVDDEQRIVTANPAAAAALGLHPDEVTGTDAITFVAARQVPDFRRALREASRGSSSSREYTLPSSSNSSPRLSPSVSAFAAVRSAQKPRSVAWSMALVSTAPRLVACVGVDVTALRDEVESLRSRASTDDLTGLPNRAALLDHLTTVATAGATVVFCDLNRFKAVNDTLGHAAGDAVLVQAARRLRRTVRGEDFVARLSGDEFVIVVANDDDTSFDGLARRLLRAIEQPMV